MALAITHEIPERREVSESPKKAKFVKTLVRQKTLREAEGISASDLQTLKAFKSPPQAVKDVLDLACLLLGEREPDWKKQLASPGNFLTSVDSFDPTHLNEV